MYNKDKLEDYVRFGISGVPEIKKDEKKVWLGVYRERVLFALDKSHLTKAEHFEGLEAKAKDQRVHQIIVNSTVIDSIRIKCMQIAKKYEKDFKTVNGQSDIAIILASKDAIDIENVFPF